jgi:hypothetical protein
MRIAECEIRNPKIRDRSVLDDGVPARTSVRNERLYWQSRANEQLYYLSP